VASTTRASPATKLPLEIIQMIIAHLAYDTPNLLTCTLTCYSWYLAAVPRLHRTLVTHTDGWDWKFQWPTPSATCTHLACFVTQGILGPGRPSEYGFLKKV